MLGVLITETRSLRSTPDAEELDFIALGNACSEIFVGPTLAHILRPGHEYEARVLRALEDGGRIQPLLQHIHAVMMTVSKIQADTSGVEVPRSMRLAMQYPAETATDVDRVEWLQLNLCAPAAPPHSCGGGRPAGSCLC